MVAVSTSNEQPKFWHKGQYIPAEKIGNDWIVNIDGKNIKVDPNDLFGINQYRQEAEEYLQKKKEGLFASFTERINNIDKYIAKLEKSIKQSKIMGLNGKVIYKNNKESLNQYLSSANCETFYDLSNSQQKEARVYMTGMNDGKKMMRRSDSNIFSTSHQILSEYLYKHDQQNQIALAETMLG